MSPAGKTDAGFVHVITPLLSDNAMYPSLAPERILILPSTSSFSAGEEMPIPTLALFPITTALLVLTVVFAPIAVALVKLLLPTLALKPIAVLLLPVVLSVKAYLPTATFS